MGKIGIIVAALSAAILFSMAIIIFATADTLRLPGWLPPVVSLLALAGILLMLQGSRQKQLPSQNIPPPP